MTTDMLYAPPDVEAAVQDWQASCGPGALAALLHCPVNATRPWFPSYRGWTTPPAMRATLALARCPFTVVPVCDSLHYGLAFLQWTGRWTQPGVPARAAYRHTHWIGVADTEDCGEMVYDFNIFPEDAPRGQWVVRRYWEKQIVPAVLEDLDGADGWYYPRWECQVGGGK